MLVRQLIFVVYLSDGTTKNNWRLIMFSNNINLITTYFFQMKVNFHYFDCKPNVSASGWLLGDWNYKIVLDRSSSQLQELSGKHPTYLYFKKNLPETGFFGLVRHYKQSLNGKIFITSKLWGNLTIKYLISFTSFCMNG